MKKLLLLFICISVFAGNAQNGFTTYTGNLTISGSAKVQTAFLVDNNSNKWIGFRTLGTGANAGLVKFDNTSWTLYNSTSTPAFPSNNVTALAKDNSGNIWIGTNDIGLVKFDGSTFTVFNTTNGLPANIITCLESIGGQVYIGTKSGLSRFDGVTFTNYNVANGKLPSDTVTCIKAESSNLLWLGGYNRMVEFSINNSFSITGFVNHTIPMTQQDLNKFNYANNINCIYIDPQNDKWLGSANAGILKYNGSNFQNAYSLYDIFGSVIPTNVFDIGTGLHNGIVFKNKQGSANDNLQAGLTELSPNNKVYQYFHPVRTFNMGNFIENDGTNILLSVSGFSASAMYHEFNATNYSTPLGSVNTNNFKTLDINNVKAGISNRSDMHWDIGGNGNTMYEVPKGSGKHSNFASALWIGGLDNASQLHGAAQLYRQSGVDFWPGPLDTIAATIDTVTSKNYDKIWKVSYTDINTFINAYNSGSVVATPDMLTWPAHGSGNNSRNLAPFVDHNGDGLYNPNDGDYPKIKGDQALYFIYNDKLAAHSTSYTPMGVEVQGMAYAYGCPAVVNGHNELTYTTFYDYKIINRSFENYHDVFVSMWSDVDLGYYGDDYIGSNVSDNYGYAYNADSYDECVASTCGYGTFAPTQGFNIVKGPLANVNDGIDNNNNGVTDEPGEDCKLNTFNYFNNSFAGVPLQTANPATGQQYYNYMTGFWRDGTPFTCGGNAYGGSIPTNYVYPADTYTNGGCGAAPWTETGVAGDRRMILSSGPFTLNAGQMQEVEYAFVTSFDSSSTTNSNMLSLAKLKTDIQKVNTFYNQVNKPNCLQNLVTGITEVAKQENFSIYPNPAKSMLNVLSTINGEAKVSYEVLDVLGKTVIKNENTNSDKFTVNISDLNSGIYFLRLQVNNSIVVKKFVKE